MPQISSASASKGGRKNGSSPVSAGRAWKIQPVVLAGSSSLESKARMTMMRMVEEAPSFLPSIPFVGGGPGHHSKRTGGHGQGGAFVYDNVFDEESTTAQLYDEVVKPVVRAVVEGRHATVCAYGATKSGKTYTMQGGGCGKGDRQHGVIQRAAADLFEHVEKDLRRNYKVTAQYFEVYNEQLRDLLVGADERGRAPIPSKTKEANEEEKQIVSGDEEEEDEEDDVSDDDTVSLVPPAPSTRGKNLSPRKLLHSFAVASTSTASKPSLVNRPTAPSAPSDVPLKHQRKAPSVRPQIQLREVNGVLTVPAVEEEICSVEDVIQLLDHGAKNRAVAKVLAGPMMAQSHHVSSRSHAIFRITVESHAGRGPSPPALKDATRWVSVLNLVDLAGSENTDRSGTSGLRLREGGTINQRSVRIHVNGD
jgi:Kinesin motor domain